MDSRLLAFAPLALLGAAGLVRRGTRAAAVAHSRMRPQTAKARIDVFAYEGGTLGTGEGVSASIRGVEGAYGEFVFFEPKDLQEYVKDYAVETHIPERGKVALLAGIELPEGMRGKGIGSEMLRQGIEATFSQGVRSIYLVSLPDPKSLYLRFGFEEVDAAGYWGEMGWMRLRKSDWKRRR
jgi:N-acetylglutamate synthase-like GNAT family acetyltransferase